MRRLQACLQAYFNNPPSKNTACESLHANPISFDACKLACVPYYNNPPSKNTAFESLHANPISFDACKLACMPTLYNINHFIPYRNSMRRMQACLHAHILITHQAQTPSVRTLLLLPFPVKLQAHYHSGNFIIFCRTLAFRSE
jgi:hypothetical protein